MSFDTIAAIATPPGAGGVGIVRVSGKKLDTVIQSLCQRSLKPRYATYTPFFDADHIVIDHGIALYFPAPHSFTGESVLELQAHGGRFVLEAVLVSVLSTGVRLAKPGEFSYRAYLNGKMDLLQAEAIADMISAGSEQAMRSAAQSLQGQFSAEVNALREAVNGLRVYIEASIDFTDEEIDFLSEGAVVERLNSVSEQLEGLLESAKQGVLLQEGATIAIIGSPNVGKSSLLNQLTGRDSAIVTSQAGTTRDTLKELIHCHGLPIHIIDTAGIRETDDMVEKEGISRAWSALNEADAIIFVSDASIYATLEDDPMWQEMQSRLSTSIPVISIANKQDKCEKTIKGYNITLSAKTGEGMERLRYAITDLMGYQSEQEAPFLARRRHLDALTKAGKLLTQCLEALVTDPALELLAEDLKAVDTYLGELTGETTADALLGDIFSSFCIGK